MPVSQHDPRLFFACLSQATFSEAGSLYRSVDVAQTSRRIDHGVTAEYMVMAAATQPTDEDSAFCVTRSGQVIGADDPGASWQGFRLPQGVHNVYAVACI